MSFHSTFWNVRHLKFENGGFTLKPHQIMFSLHTSPEEFKNATITGHFGFVFEENSVKEITYDYRDGIVFKRLRFKNVFHPHENAKLAF